MDAPERAEEYTPQQLSRREALQRLAIFLGGTPIGAPILGWVADHFGPRLALGVGAASGFAAAVVALGYMAAGRREKTPLAAHS